MHIFQLIEEGSDDNYDIGANPSAEEEAEGTEAAVSTGINVVLAQRLIEMELSKDQYKKDVKNYAKSLLTKVGETNPERAAFLKENLPKIVSKWITEFKELSIYQGESMGEGGTYVLCKYPDGECPIGTKIDVYVLKDAVEEEKCVSLQNIGYYIHLLEEKEWMQKLLNLNHN